MLERMEIAGRRCACFVPQGTAQRILVLCGWHMEEMLPALAAETPGTLLFFAEADGGRDFTPWPAPPVREGDAFTGEAAAYLHFLTAEALPLLRARYGVPAGPAHTAVAGYSLGGLFALWAACAGETFGMALSLSGSTWYPNFLDCVKRQQPPRGTRFYLSLGDREPFGGPPLLRQVGACTEALRAFLEAAGYAVTFEWNKGGHGKGIENRWKKALHHAAAVWKESGYETADLI